MMCSHICEAFGLIAAVASQRLACNPLAAVWDMVYLACVADPELGRERLLCCSGDAVAVSCVPCLVGTVEGLANVWSRLLSLAVLRVLGLPVAPRG